ncbi:hypothetical protein [Methylotenera sp. G11]|uniref:hypothetical protein n=1 Tax=Methylotenera sp. G11 TaxID=1506585 RepID=UPI000648988D|nr:hypothetical protein [Methylotenera sp. G11]
MNKPELLKAVELALSGDWDGAHNIAQDYGDATANWLHAVLHKVEGDAWNSRYWYARSAGRAYEDFADARDELLHIQKLLSS